MPHSVLLAPGQAPPPGYVLEGSPQQMRSRGLHPLVKSSCWYLLGCLIPCVGWFMAIRAYQLAGQGRQLVRTSRGRYTGEGVGQAVQICCWLYLGLNVLQIVLAISGGDAGPRQPPPPTIGP
jgi:hypothetical protein